MKKLILLVSLVFSLWPISGQAQLARYLKSSGAPTGACSEPYIIDVDVLNGVLYACSSGAWVSIGPGAAGSAAFNTITNGTATSKAFVIGNSTTLAFSGSGTILDEIVKQNANGDTAVTVTRNTDTLPTGNFESFLSAGASALWTVDITGSLAAGGVPIARLTGGPLGASLGGTGLASGTSGGILCFTGSTTIASSAALTSTAVLLGGGAGVCPSGSADFTIVSHVLTSGGSGLVNFTAMTGANAGKLLPVQAGATATANGALAYDSTNNMLHAGQSSADAMIPQFTVTPTNGHCVSWVVSGSNYKQGDTLCGSSAAGSTGDIQINSSGSLAAGNANQGSDGSINASKSITQPTPSVPTYNAGGTTTCDLSAATVCKIAMSGGNTTLAVSNPHGGTVYTLLVTQDSSTRTFSYPAAFQNVCQPSPIASSVTEITFHYDGSTNYYQDSCVSNDTPYFAVLPTRSAPSGTPADSSTNWCWQDSTDQTTRCKDTNGNIYVMPKGLSSATGSNWVQYIDQHGVQHLSQPAFSDISSTATPAQITADANTIKNAIDCPDTSASANTITCVTTTTYPLAYAAGQSVIVKVANANTGATTININSLGAKNVTKNGGTALASGDLTTKAYLLRYDGTEFDIVGSIGGSGGSGGGVLTYSATSSGLTGTQYLPVGGGGVGSTTEANVQTDLRVSATISNFAVNVSQAFGTGNSAAFTWRLAGSDQSVTCTISGASATNCGDTTHSFSVSSGQLVDIKVVYSGTIGVTPQYQISTQIGTTNNNGTVNTGTQGQWGYYASAGTAMSGVGPGSAGQIAQSNGTSGPQFNDFSDVKIIPFANCNAGTAGMGASTASSNFTAACRAGTNNLGGAAQAVPSTGASLQFMYELTGDWSTSNQPYIDIYYGSGSNTSGTVIWTVSSACVDVSTPGGASDDPSFVAESAFASQTMANANRMWYKGAQFSNITSGNNCKANGFVIIKAAVSGTAGSNINGYYAVLTQQRRPVVQAN